MRTSEIVSESQELVAVMRDVLSAIAAVSQAGDAEKLRDLLVEKRDIFWGPDFMSLTSLLLAGRPATAAATEVLDQLAGPLGVMAALVEHDKFRDVLVTETVKQARLALSLLDELAKALPA
jgi:hypothetical protein